MNEKFHLINLYRIIMPIIFNRGLAVVDASIANAAHRRNSLSNPLRWAAIILTTSTWLAGAGVLNSQSTPSTAHSDLKTKSATEQHPFSQSPQDTLSWKAYQQNPSALDEIIQLGSSTSPDYTLGFTLTELLSRDSQGIPRYLTLNTLKDSSGTGIPDVMRDYFGVTSQSLANISLPDKSGYTLQQKYQAGQDLADPTQPLQSWTYDGIPNVWKIKHGFDPLNTQVAADDPDADMFSNTMEYFLGTDPLKANVDKNQMVKTSETGDLNHFFPRPTAREMNQQALLYFKALEAQAKQQQTLSNKAAQNQAIGKAQDRNAFARGEFNQTESQSTNSSSSGIEIVMKRTPAIYANYSESEEIDPWWQQSGSSGVVHIEYQSPQYFSTKVATRGAVSNALGASLTSQTGNVIGLSGYNDVYAYLDDQVGQTGVAPPAGGYFGFANANSYSEEYSMGYDENYVEQFLYITGESINYKAQRFYLFSRNTDPNGPLPEPQDILLLRRLYTWDRETDELESIEKTFETYTIQNDEFMAEDVYIDPYDKQQDGKDVYESVILIPVELLTDLNNDGKINSADSTLVGKPYKEGATEEEIAEGTEYMFVNDEISNGASDGEDTTIEHESFEDDDAEGIRIKFGLNTGKIWLEHPAIESLSFYTGKECYADQRINIKEDNPFDLAGQIPLPEMIYARCDEALDVSAEALQAAGDLVLKFLAGGSGQPVQAAKTRLVVVKDFGAPDFFRTARDYIMTENARFWTGEKSYGGGKTIRILTMREEACRMKSLDTYWLPTKLWGIDAVTNAYPGASVAINGNMTFDKRRISVLQELTARCQGRLVSGGVLNANVSSDNDDPTIPAPSDPLRGSVLAGDQGKYIAMLQDYKFHIAKGRVPIYPLPKEAMGGWHTNYTNVNQNTIVGIGKVDDEHRMVFTILVSGGSGFMPQIAADAKTSGVPDLPGGNPGNLMLIIGDGGTSRALAYKDPSEKWVTPVKGGKHTMTAYLDYCINTYLLFIADKPRNVQ